MVVVAERNVNIAYAVLTPVLGCVASGLGWLNHPVLEGGGTNAWLSVIGQLSVRH